MTGSEDRDLAPIPVRGGAELPGRADRDRYFDFWALQCPFRRPRQPRRALRRLEEIVTHKPSKLERQLVTVEGRLSYLLDYALSQGLPQLRQALAILAEPCLSGDRRRWALRDIRLGVSALHSLCRAHRK